MTQKDIKHIELLIRNADMENTPEAYSDIYERLGQLESKYPDDHLIAYYKGLSCYLNPDIEQFRTKWAAKHFEEALALAPGHLMSEIYLAYCYFDLNEPLKASNLFNKILSDKANLDILSDEQQDWRIVNMVEMLAVCKLKLGHFYKFHNIYEVWKNLYYIYIRKDNFYFPESLVVETAGFLQKHGDSLKDHHIIFFRSVSMDLIGLIKGGDDFEEIYAEELEKLRSWDGHQFTLPANIFSK